MKYGDDYFCVVLVWCVYFNEVKGLMNEGNKSSSVSRPVFKCCYLGGDGWCVDLGLNMDS